MANGQERATLSDYLLREGLITPQQLQQARIEQATSTRSLGRILVELGLLKEADRIRVLQKRFGLELHSLAGVRVEPPLLALIPFAFAEKHRVVPVRLAGPRTLVVAMEDPSDELIIAALARQTGLAIQPVIATSDDLGAVLDQYGLAAEARRLGPAGLTGRGEPARTKALGVAGLISLDLLPLALLGVAVGCDLMGLKDRLADWLTVQRRFTLWDLTLYTGLAWGLWTVILIEIGGLILNRRKE